jgi:hypothetical protein
MLAALSLVHRVDRAVLFHPVSGTRARHSRWRDPDRLDLCTARRSPVARIRTCRCAVTYRSPRNRPRTSSAWTWLMVAELVRHEVRAKLHGRKLRQWHRGMQYRPTHFRQLDLAHGVLNLDAWLPGHESTTAIGSISWSTSFGSRCSWSCCGTPELWWTPYRSKVLRRWPSQGPRTSLPASVIRVGRPPPSTSSG